MHFTYFKDAGDRRKEGTVLFNEGLNMFTAICHLYIGYSFRLAARDHLHAPFHKQDSIYNDDLCYTSHGTLARTSNRSMSGSTMKDQ